MQVCFVDIDGLVATCIVSKLNPYHDVLWNNRYAGEFERLCKDTNLRMNVLHATEEIAAMCDGALSEDGFGFSKYDTKTGHMMVRMARFADPKRLRAWTRTLYKYRGQLGLSDDGFYKRIFG